MGHHLFKRKTNTHN